MDNLQLIFDLFLMAIVSLIINIVIKHNNYFGFADNRDDEEVYVFKTIVNGFIVLISLFIICMLHTEDGTEFLIVVAGLISAGWVSSNISENIVKKYQIKFTKKD